jgi:predicted RNA-binding protein with TRAM domain
VNTVHNVLRFNRTALWAAILLAVMSLTSAGTASAYTQLQVLLPGESPAPGTATGKTGVPDAQTVGVPFTVTVRACDASWYTDATVTNVVSLASSDASATLPSPTALVDGETTLIVTFNSAGSFNVTATDESDPTIPDATSASTTAYVLHGFEFSSINQKNQYAGVPMSITVWAVDPVGEIVSGFSGPVRLQEITSYGEGRIEPSLVTLTNGSWSGSVTMYRADETSINRGNVNINARLDADPTKNGTSDPFTIHPGPFSRVQIVVPGQDPLPGSVTGLSGSPASQGAGQTFTVDVYATDEYWNPLPSGDVVRVTSSDAAASTPVSGALSNGFRQFTLSLGTVGTQTLSVVDQTNGSIQGMTSAGILVTPSAPHHFEIEQISSPIVAGDQVAVTIRATDVGGNTIPDYSGNAVLTANTGPASITPEAITFTAGVWTGNMVFRGAGGAVSFSCSDFSSPPHVGTSNSFEVQPGPYSGLQVLLPGQTPQGGTASGFTGTPNDQNAGSTFTLTIRAVDQFWNRVPGINSAISLSSSDPFAGIPSDTNLVNGELIMPATLYKIGNQTISAADTETSGITPHTSSPVYVLPGTYSRIVLIAPGEEVAPGTEEGRTGSPTDQSINFSFMVKVYATDQWWNPVGAVTDVVRITSGDPLAELPPDAAMVDGYAEFSIRLSTGGFQQITASNVTQPAMPTSTTQVRVISSGFHLETEVHPTAVQAGEPFDLTVKVTNDAGSVIQEINSFVTIEVQNASTRDPGQGTLLTTQFQLLQGQRTVAETYTFSESIVLVVRDDAGNAPAVTEVIEVSPGAPTELRLSSSPSWVGGNKHATIRARVLDQFENGVPDQPVEFTLVSGQGTLTPVDSLTTSDGGADADFLSPREPGVTRIRASSSSLVAEYDIETALVDPNKPGGTITSYPNPFHPDEGPTTIAYKLDNNARVTLKIYSLTGALVLRREFAEGSAGGVVGLNEYQWDGRNGDGIAVASGGYIVVVEAVHNGQTIHNMRRKVAAVR